MIEIGSYWQHIITSRVVKIIEVRTELISVEYSYTNTTFNMYYDKEFFIKLFEKLTSLEVELL